MGLDRDEITKTYTGFTNQILTPDNVQQMFDAIYGADFRHLPSYPEILGSFKIDWQDAEGNIHRVKHLDRLIEAYSKQLTAKISIIGRRNNQPQCMITYFPAGKKARVTATGNLEQVDQALDNFRKFFPVLKKILTFISYETTQIEAAFFVASLLKKRWANDVESFIAKRDIPSGRHPFQVMLEKNLLEAEAMVSICSEKSMSSRWLWWETAAVWARRKKVYPLYAGISPHNFGDPIKTLFQGKNFFDIDEMNQWLNDFAKDLNLPISDNLEESEIQELGKLKEKTFTNIEPVADQEADANWIAEARKRGQEGLFK